jgi:HD-GYP domain-containing protein (c-di-GMP phosphodiesterase class II)
MEQALKPEFPDASRSSQSRPSDAHTGWPIKPLIACVVVLAMLAVAITVISVGWKSVRQSMLDTAATQARDAGRLITEKSHRMLEPAQATLRLMATTSLVGASTLQDRLVRLRTLTEVLRGNPLVSAVYVGYPDGSFMLVRPLEAQVIRMQFDAPPAASFLVQSIERNRPLAATAQAVGSYLFFTAELKLIESRPATNYQFDPRTRPWYQSAMRVTTTVATQPYVFFTTQQVGLTLSQSSVDRQAVFGVDVVLDDLARSLAALKITANTQLALVDAEHRVLAYPDMARVLVRTGAQFDFKTVEDLGEPSLASLFALNSPVGEVVPYRANGADWQGVVLPFDVWRANGMRLLVAMPSGELLGPLKDSGKKLIYWVLGLVALLVPLGWWAGAAVGKSLDQLSLLADRITHFNFDAKPNQRNPVREANVLNDAMGTMALTIKTFLAIGKDMATEPKVDHMLANVLDKVMSATQCTGGAVYLREAAGAQFSRAAQSGVMLAHESPTLQHHGEGDGSWARRTVTSGVAEIRVELRGRQGRLEGILALQHTIDEGHSDQAFTEFVNQLSGMLAVSIETRQLIQAQRDLLDAVIRLMADAIDAKSPYTGGHCERVPVLAGRLVDALSAETSGPYAAFSMSEDERYAFHLGAWLHDCGKVTSPEHIIDKSTKLEVIYNRIHEIRTRFEVLWRDAEIACWQGIAQGGDAATLQAALSHTHSRLQDDFAFVATCNIGSESMASADLQRLNAIAQTPWMRHFDNRLGISNDEALRVSAVPHAPLPAPEVLLSNRPEHLVHWGERKPPVEKDDARNRHGFDMALPAHAQNMGELYNLRTRRGTLTEEDRFKINDHIVQTLIMLRSLPWPEQLGQVPDFAATHHEKLDGTGYPRRLPGSALSTGDRVMALADVFEALTAADRPYKAPKTLSQSFHIMVRMVREHHLDGQLLRYFLQSGLWQQFAQDFLLPSQIDEVDVAGLEQALDSISHPIATKDSA